MSAFEEKVAAMERDLNAVGQMWVQLHKKITVCSGRDDGGDHLPRFSGEDPTMRCTYCNEPLVVV